MSNPRDIFARAKYEQKIIQLEQNYIVQLRDGRIGFVITNNTGYDHWNDLAERWEYEIVRPCIYIPTYYNGLTRIHKGEDYFLKNYTRGLYYGEYGQRFRSWDVMKIKENTSRRPWIEHLENNIQDYEWDWVRDEKIKNWQYQADWEQYDWWWKRQGVEEK